MLNHELETLDGLHDEIAKEYKSNGHGKFVLDLDTNPLAAKVKEFRDNNTQLKQNNEDLRAERLTYGDHTPETIAELMTTVETFESEGTPDEKQAAIYESRINEMKSAQAKELGAKQTVITEYQRTAAEAVGKLQNFQIERDILGAVNRVSKPRTGALSDILSRARDTWKFDDEGILTALESNGDQKFNGTGDPLTPDEWVGQLVENAPFLFDVQGGGDAPGGGGTQNNRGGGRTYAAGDPVAHGSNLKAIAAGTMKPRS